jgi:hypothetical protein
MSTRRGVWTVCLVAVAAIGLWQCRSLFGDRRANSRPAPEVPSGPDFSRLEVSEEAEGLTDGTGTDPVDAVPSHDRQRAAGLSRELRVDSQRRDRYEARIAAAALPADRTLDARLREFVRCPHLGNPHCSRAAGLLRSFREDPDPVIDYLRQRFPADAEIEHYLRGGRDPIDNPAALLTLAGMLREPRGCAILGRGIAAATQEYFDQRQELTAAIAAAEDPRTVRGRRSLVSGAREMAMELVFVAGAAGCTAATEPCRRFVDAHASGAPGLECAVYLAWLYPDEPLSTATSARWPDPPYHDRVVQLVEPVE